MSNSVTDFVYNVRVYIEDTDFGGVVYHANYLKFFERARTEWLRTIGYEQDNLLAEGICFVVRTLTIDYQKPARFNDRLRIQTAIGKRGLARVVFKQMIYREQSEELLCSADVTVVCVNQDFRPRKLPNFLRHGG